MLGQEPRNSKEKEMNAEKCAPIRKNVLLDVYEWPDKTRGGIWLPDMVKYSETKGGKDPWRGKVLAIGPEVTQVTVGEVVRYQPENYTGFTFYDDKRKRFIILDEVLIYAVEDEDENLIRALKNRLVFYPDRLKEKYGNLYLPQNREEPLLYGTIIVAGEDAGVAKGDKVVIKNRSTFQYFDSAGKRFVITDKYNLLAKSI